MSTAATAAGSSPRLCVDKECPPLMLPLYWWLLYAYTIFHVWSGFQQIACAIGGVISGAWFA